MASYIDANVLGLQNLLEASVKNDVKRFIQISTSSVYGKDAVGDESSPTNPYSPYGVSKLAAEKLAQAYSENYDLDVTILRYYSVFGPRQRPDMAYFKFIKAIEEGTKFEIFGDGLQTRTNTFVRDITRATSSFLAMDNTESVQIYNLSGSESIKLIDAIKCIESIIGNKAKFEYLEKRAGDQRATRGIYTKAEKAIGYSPTTLFFEGIEKQITWQLGR
jgi:nucleoside-diphosphate-sugar epimerase